VVGELQEVLECSIMHKTVVSAGKARRRGTARADARSDKNFPAQLERQVHIIGDCQLIKSGILRDMRLVSAPAPRVRGLQVLLASALPQRERGVSAPSPHGRGLQVAYPEEFGELGEVSAPSPHGRGLQV
jgi:hypothetical protein